MVYDCSSDQLENNVEWKVIPGYEDYEASSDGQIRRCRNLKRNYMVGKVLKQKMSIHGYFVVSLFGDGRYYHAGVHRLVCMAFHGPAPSDDMQVCHGDGVRTNNLPANLRWGTPKENAEDRAQHGQWECQKGSEHHQAVLDETKVAEMRRLAKSGATIVSLAALFGVHKVTARDAIQGVTWKHVEEPPEASRKARSRKPTRVAGPVGAARKAAEQPLQPQCSSSA